ncbi:MAG: hypothetical protein LBP53_00005, partial [Candidatus Peribacteria bacterium]|nr:hypothetical protein [Candidatus Peribacteria bacterium]
NVKILTSAATRYLYLFDRTHQTFTAYDTQGVKTNDANKAMYQMKYLCRNGKNDYCFRTAYSPPYEGEKRSRRQNRGVGTASQNLPNGVTTPTEKPLNQLFLLMLLLLPQKWLPSFPVCSEEMQINEANNMAVSQHHLLALQKADIIPRNVDPMQNISPYEVVTFIHTSIYSSSPAPFTFPERSAIIFLATCSGTLS